MWLIIKKPNHGGLHHLQHRHDGIDLSREGPIRVLDDQVEGFFAGPWRPSRTGQIKDWNPVGPVTQHRSHPRGLARDRERTWPHPDPTNLFGLDAHSLAAQPEQHDGTELR